MSTYYPTEPMPVLQHHFWWDAEPGSLNRAARIFDTAKMLRDEQSYLRERFRMAVKMYENVECEDLDAWRYGSPTNMDGPFQRNICEMYVDTIHADIIANRTKPVFITFGGDWDAAQKAQNLSRFTDGVFHENKIHSSVGPEVCRDALVFGTGMAKVGVERIGPRAGRVSAYRIFPWELVFDDIEASNCPPTYMIHVSFASKSYLRMMYKDNPDALLIIDRTSNHLFKNRKRGAITDIVEIAEAWRLKDAHGPGIKTICTSQGCLEDEEWDKPFFPIVQLRYKTRTKGFLGKGVPEMIESQNEVINSLHEKIISQLEGASPFIWTKPGSILRESHLSNEIWRVIEADEMPQHIAYNAVPPDLLNGLDREHKQAADQIGVNMAMADSAIPAGLAQGSGRQLRIYNDTKSKRFKRFADLYENWHIELAEMMIDMIADEAKESSYTTNATHEGALIALDYNEIKLPENSFVIRPAPENFLSDTPAERVAEINELGQVAPDNLKPYLFRLIENPDVEAATSIVAGSDRAVEKILSRLLHEPKREVSDMPPNEFMNLPEALRIARDYIVMAMANEAPWDRTQKLIDWANLCKDQLDAITMKMQAAAAPQQPPMPVAPTPMPQTAVNTPMAGAQSAMTPPSAVPPMR